MLSLKNIIKNYKTGDTEVPALKGIDIRFRESEFVAVLGQSGCGKTTLLNIIGGLDRYTSGDLIINGKSTKEFKDRDWDFYRNHSIGFVFQSYNLIPHQTVLSNVELALTLSGVSKSERRRRATEALEKVGLGDQLKKKPNQMSGGQMQRVAIARALVNNPDILLADEPTGALDSATSIQIMDILKDIAKEKLVIMVTHNPDLAEEYATRTVKLLDGKIISDSNPYTAEDEKAPVSVKRRKTSMSFFTALSLSRNNLITKKARTVLTAFAGSIGIIGIALILSVSTGVNNYINDVQEETLTSYPITLEAESVDMSAVLTSMTEERSKEGHDDNKIHANNVMYDMLNRMSNSEKTVNDLKSFKTFIESGDSDINNYLTGIQYGYDLDLGIYTKDDEGTINKADLESLMTAMYGDVASSSMMSAYYDSIQIWQELMPGENGELISDVTKEQYERVTGNWPENYDEVVLIVNGNNEINDFVTYSLGLKPLETYKAEFKKYMEGDSVEVEDLAWSYDDIMNITPKIILPTDCYTYDEKTQTYSDLRETETGLEYLYANKSTELKIVGIYKASSDSGSLLSGGIAYTSALTDYIIEKSSESDIIAKQLENKDTDIITNLPFPTDEETPVNEKVEMAKSYLKSLTGSDKASAYIAIMSIPPEDEVAAFIEARMSQADRSTMEATVKQIAARQMAADEETLNDYVSKMTDEELTDYMQQILSEQYKAQYAEKVEASLSALPSQTVEGLLDSADFTEDDYVSIYDNIIPATVSESTYEDNLDILGYVDKDSPDSINLYVSTFDDKDKISDIISDYNEGKAEEDKITYVDYVALLMSGITTIINAISYVLMAFVAISLVVSSIMIGIITYISVLERTKEIGILRAIGASKKDIKRVFNAETFIVGLFAGLLGIGITLLLLIPINAIIHKLTEIETLTAALPPVAGIILVAISVILTLVAGLLPSMLAAKKDPVEALRTE